MSLLLRDTAEMACRVAQRITYVKMQMIQIVILILETILQSMK
jgi:hypothetical protein